MKTIKQFEPNDKLKIMKIVTNGRFLLKEDVIKLIDELQNKASNEIKNSKDKRYWLGCCQILNELKKEIEGK